MSNLHLRDDTKVVFMNKCLVRTSSDEAFIHEESTSEPLYPFTLLFAVINEIILLATMAYPFEG